MGILPNTNALNLAPDSDITLDGECAFSMKVWGNQSGDGILGHATGSQKIISLGTTLFVRPISSSFNPTVVWRTTSFNTIVIKRDAADRWWVSFNGQKFLDGGTLGSGTVTWNRIGWATSQESWLNKPIAEYAFWEGGSLSQLEADQIYQGIPADKVKPDKLIGYYKLDYTATENLSEIHRDLSPQGNNLTESSESVTAFYRMEQHPPMRDLVVGPLKRAIKGLIDTAAPAPARTLYSRIYRGQV